MDKITQEQVAPFLDGLSELTRKHRIVIDGCFCHGSPYLIALENATGAYSIDEEYQCLEFGKKQHIRKRETSSLCPGCGDVVERGVYCSDCSSEEVPQ